MPEWLQSAVFGHAQEDDPVDGELDGGVQVFDGKSGISKGKVMGESFPPAFDFFEELFVDRGGPGFFFEPAYLSKAPVQSA